MPRRKAAKNCELRPWLSANIDNRDGRFLQIGNSLLCGKNSAFKKLTSGAKMLFLCMAMESGGKSEVAFSRSTAEKYGIGKNVLLRQIRELREAGFIDISENFSYQQFAPTVYRFTLDWKKVHAPGTGSGMGGK